MNTRQDGCRPMHQQDGGIAIVAPMRRIARAGFVVGIVVLAILLLTPGAFPTRSSLLRLGFGLPCLGALFEILQIFVPGREAAVGDAMANTIGVAIGLTPFVIVQLGRIVRSFPARPERI